VISSSRWGILGGGFGLYGYLPALAGLGVREFFVPARHRAFMEGRHDIREYASLIRWCDDSATLVSSVESLVLAVPPLQQEDIVMKLCAGRHLKQLVMEKPVAHSPSCGDSVIASARDVATSVRIAFICKHAPWAIALLDNCQNYPTGMISIEWTFMAHHLKTNMETWKARHENGGGALRFYGIHLIALLAEASFRTVVNSELTFDEQGRAIRWAARFRSPNGSTAAVTVDCSSGEQRFRIRRRTPVGEYLVELPNPFAEFDSATSDCRIAPLQALLQTFSQPNERYYDLYSSANELWMKAELCCRFSTIGC
jgi:predicted dehydrogenase